MLGLSHLYLQFVKQKRFFQPCFPSTSSALAGYFPKGTYLQVSLKVVQSISFKGIQSISFKEDQSISVKGVQSFSVKGVQSISFKEDQSISFKGVQSISSNIARDTKELRMRVNFFLSNDIDCVANLWYWGWSTLTGFPKKYLLEIKNISEDPFPKVFSRLLPFLGLFFCSLT